MNEITFPTQSKATLVKATFAAVIMASIIFILVILPAEYNVDFLGTGKLMGLTVLSEEAAPPLKAPSGDGIKEPEKNNVVVIVPANTGVEYKFKIKKHGNLTYEWSTDGGAVFFDFHGEPEGDTTGYFESYTIATAKEVKGSMTVPFDGVHGWYWKNEGDTDVQVTLKTQGLYEIVGLIH